MSREPRPSEPPIFIVGCQRSGTSLLRRIVDSHSRIACPPESKFLLPLTDVLRDDQALRGLDSMGYSRAETSAILADVATTLFAGYARARGKVRWADKTPNYVACLPELFEIFPDARFVLIVRHGLDVAYSLSNPSRRFPALDNHVAAAGGDRRVAAGRFWVDQNDAIERFRLAHAASCLRVRYEDLTADPGPTARAVFEFVGEAWEPDVLDYNRFRHDAGMEDPSVRWRDTIETISGKWAAWPPDVQAAVTAVCAPMLVALGYEATKHPADTTP